ncbi:hypothetical protein [Halobacterium wangiae]|uniref:hypothetical protein n=1 Tax=Halobacterium wangiae TaxID=2902623 RepID=UPI001E575599|nr:hypothetical protein [Halobacterium wangiae]
MATIAVALLLVTTGCTTFSQSNSEAPTTTELTPTQTTEPTATETVTSTPETTTTTESAKGHEWNATVDIRPEKTSLAAGNTVFNGWNVSIEVTSLDGADEIIYVYEGVNVVQGNSTHEGVVGAETGDTSSPGALSLLQRNETVTVYAVKSGERKQIGFHKIPSSYTAPWNGERSWNASWRGEPPEEMET